MFITCATHQGRKTWRLGLFRLKPQYLGVEECPAHGQGEEMNEWMNEWTLVGWSCRHLDFWDGSLSIPSPLCNQSLSKLQSEVAQSCPTLCDTMDCHLWGSSVHGIFQARVLEWVSISFSRGSSQPRDRTRSPALQGQMLYHLSYQGSPIEMITLKPCLKHSGVLLPLGKHQLL